MIDWDRVAELREEVGEDSFAEVVALFIEEMDVATAELSPQAGGVELADALHFIKGSALNLGFDRLAALCDRGEQEALAGRQTAVDLAGLRDVYTRSRQHLVEAASPST